MNQYQFSGKVMICRFTPAATTLTLSGILHGADQEKVYITLSGRELEHLPASLHDPILELSENCGCKLTAGQQVWQFKAVAQVHRSVAIRFFAAVPPRATPLKKRLLWRAALGLASKSWIQRCFFKPH
jgi:hypothetical protein